MIQPPPHARLRRRGIDVGDGIVPIAVAGDGPAVILLHGWTLDWRMWMPQVEMLAREFRLVMPDRRGFGRSTAPPGLQREADDIERIADCLCFERYSLVGISQGAVIALDCACSHAGRVDCVVASGSPLPTLVERDERIDLGLYADWARNGRMEAVRADWSGHDLMQHENPRTGALVDEILAEYSGRDLLAPSALPGLPRETLSRLPMPLLALTGAGDSCWRRACALALADVVPHGNHALVEGAGHLANLDQPEVFNRIVRDFLVRCVQTRQN